MSACPTRLVGTARPSHTPLSSDGAVPHWHRHARHSPDNAERPASTAARIAGSSLFIASEVAADTCCRHSPSAAVAACHAAASCWFGSPALSAISVFSHPVAAMASRDRKRLAGQARVTVAGLPAPARLRPSWGVTPVYGGG